ncbi:MAG TPA: hypothetical protein EYQ81_05200 [Sneathiellales bacterium]|nr:hypothetical protein [Sneathiellales bacterium]
MGGHWLWLGIGAMVPLLITGDFLLGDETKTPSYSHPFILNLILYSYLPVMIVTAFLFVWSMTPGDLLGYGALVVGATGYDVLAAKAGSTLFDYTGAALGMGVTYGVILPYSREHEYEADRLGVDYMVGAGYDARQAVDF